MKGYLAILIFFLFGIISAQNPYSIKDASPAEYFGEKNLDMNDLYPDVHIRMNLPASLDPAKPTKLILYALPNGNTIEWTAGKKLNKGDDWHYDIQHIGAQTRWLRENIKDYNFVTVYLMAAAKSWGAWRTKYKDESPVIISGLVNDLYNMLNGYRPSVTISSHSGGGYFVFEYIRAYKNIPNIIERIVFLDSTYGYTDQDGHNTRLAAWLNGSKERFLNVTSYQDVTVLWDGKPLVSPQGGTWFRSLQMKNQIEPYAAFTRVENDEFVNFYSKGKRAAFILKKNPKGEIYHTVLVERNGFIDSMLSGTKYQGKGYEFWSIERAYRDFIK